MNSAPRSRSEAPRPLPQAKISEKCQGSAYVLGYTDAAGKVEGGGLGWWNADCPLEVADPNGQHAPRTLDVGKLCKGDSSCHRIDFDVTLERTSDTWKPRRVTVRYSAAPRDLVLYTNRGGNDEVVCRGPCVTTLPAGEHFLRLGPEGKNALRPEVTQARRLPASWEGVPVRLDRDTSLEGRYEVNETAMWIGGVFAIVGTVGAYTMLYGLWKKEETVTWVGAGVAAGGLGIGVPLMFIGLPKASVEVR